MKIDKIKHVLMIGHDEVVLQLNKRLLLLTKEVDEIVESRSAEEALSYLSGSENNWPDIIICDINMPIMNGWEFLEVFSELFIEKQNQSWVCMNVDNIDTYDREQALKKKNIRMFLPKPLTISSIKYLFQSYRRNAS